MIKDKYVLILFILLVPILAYVGWQAYRTYIKPQGMDITELEKPVETVTVEKPAHPVKPAEQIARTDIRRPESEPVIAELKGTLDYAGYSERDPFRPSLPIKEKAERRAEEVPEKRKEEPPKEIVLPAFSIAGVVWGYNPRAIIDGEVHMIGDTVKGAKILNITKEGIHMIYEEKEFYVTIH